jgi:hypothetical protein
LNGSGHQGPLLSPHDPHGLIYTPYAEYANYAALAASPLLTDYATADHSGGLFARWHWLPFSTIALAVEKTFIMLGLSFTYYIEPLIRLRAGKCSCHISSPLCLWRSNVHFRFKLYESLHEMFPHLYVGGFNTGFYLPCLLLMTPETQVFGVQYSIFERIDLQVLAVIEFC